MRRTRSNTGHISRNTLKPPPTRYNEEKLLKQNSVIGSPKNTDKN